MSTIQEDSGNLVVPSVPLPAIVNAAPIEPRFFFPDISWSFYLNFLQELGHRPSLRVTYDRGSMELMTVSQLHERYRKILGRTINSLTEELELPCRGGGSATFTRADLARGFEPDECYWIASEPRVRHRREVDLETDPPFDLAMEIEVSRGVLDRIAIYQALRVPELWTFDGDTLRVRRLRADGAYELGNESGIFPGLPLDAIADFVHQGVSGDESGVIRGFRAWIRQWLARGDATP